MNLTALILDVVANSNGLNHPQIVRSVLERGYEDTNLSEKVHGIICNLVYSGMISKNPETRIVQINRAC